MPLPPSLARRPLLLGVVHLPPLPGSPGWLRARRSGGAEDWLARGVADAQAYAEAGFDGVLVENYGDAPFPPGPLSATALASLAVAARAVREALPPARSVGVNALRNDGVGAVAVAAAAGLDFVRVNVLAGAFVADQGLIEGEAHRVLAERERVAPACAVLADVRVKHAAPLAPRALEDEAHDLLERSGADALVLTGPRTGAPVDADELRRLDEALPDAVLLAGSGVSPATLGALLVHADGAIVGTAAKRGGRTAAPVDPRRAAALVAAARGRSPPRGAQGRR